MTARGVIAGLLGFTLAGVVLAALLGRLLPGGWATSVFVAVGLAAAAAVGAAAGVAGAWQGTPADGIAGALLGALLLVAAQPQADLVTALSLLAVAAGATTAGLARSGPRRRAG